MIEYREPHAHVPATANSDSKSSMTSTRNASDGLDIDIAQHRRRLWLTIAAILQANT